MTSNNKLLKQQPECFPNPGSLQTGRYRVTDTVTSEGLAFKAHNFPKFTELTISKRNIETSMTLIHPINRFFLKTCFKKTAHNNNKSCK